MSKVKIMSGSILPLLLINFKLVIMTIIFYAPIISMSGFEHAYPEPHSNFSMAINTFF